jgi:putative peptidoglycan lipid II flippase
MASSLKKFHRAFMSSALGTAFSRVLGAMRDIAIAHYIGAEARSDAFFIAFTIPNIFRRFVADEGLTGAMIPAFEQADAEDDDRKNDGEPSQQTRMLANTIFTALLIANVLLCVVSFLAAEPIVLACAYAYKKDPAQLQLTIDLTRWLIPFLLMVSMVSFFEGILNYRNHFFVPKLAPGIVNLGVVACAFFLAQRLEEPVYALVYGILIGGALHVAIHFPVLKKLWGRLSLAWNFSDARFRRVAKEMSKVIAIGIFAQINILALRQFATMDILQDGSMTHYWNANRMVDLAQGVIAVAIGSALLPNISQAIARKDWEKIQSDFDSACRLAAFLLLPAAAFILVFSIPMTTMLFRHGAYSWDATVVTADTLRMMTPFMLCVAAINIVKKVYFAFDDRKTLMWVGGLGVCLTIVLGWNLVSAYKVPGLALALSLSTGAQLVAYLVILKRKFGDQISYAGLYAPFAKMAIASGAMALCLYPLLSYGSWSDGALDSLFGLFSDESGSAGLLNMGIFAGGVLLAGIVYFTAANLLKIEEGTRIKGLVMRKLGRG